jgi:DNA modification methylase
MSASEAKIFEKVHQKELKHMEMEQEMSVDVALTHEARNHAQGMEYQRREVRGKDWTVVNGDSCKEIQNIDSDSMGFSIFSPPFSSLFVYSDSIRDMGNCESDEQFFQHFAFLVPELLRITIPGRLCAVHCSQIPAHKWKDGEMGLKDFRGDIIRTFQAAGWVYHSEVCIWKDPVVEMQRTKALGLLHKQIKKNSAMSRVGMPDYLVVFRKPGDPVKPVERPNGFNPRAYIGQDGDCQTSIDVWQRYASPVWHDINQTNVLNVRVARAEKDERHLCPLQLDVIERAIHLWTIPGDTVFTPFLGIGSEVYSAVKLGRKGYGVELKPEYFNQAVQNLKSLDADKRHLSLLSLMQSEVA